MAKNFFSRFTRARAKHNTVFDGQDLKNALLAGHAWLEEHREAINALNVFPVPDGDTGTNMSLTMRAATKEIAEAQDSSAAVIADKVSRGALMGARGNSGVILSQILRGISHGLAGKETFGAVEFAAALQEGARAAYRAVIKPVEGTILTVVRESAEVAQRSAAQGADLTALLEDIVHAARASVARTPDLLPTLKQAGVVDAGGQGLTTILEGMWRYSRGESLRLNARERTEEQSEFHKGNVQIEEEFGYEVVFLLHGEHLDIENIRDTITAMGGVSTVVAGDTQLMKVHTHTLTPGKILDYGVGLGSLEDINIENLQAQSLRYAAASAAERGETPGHNGAHLSQHGAALAHNGGAMAGDAEPREIATVAVAAGEGWMQVFHSLGVAAIVPGGQTMNPSTQELLAAVEHCPSQKVILLPNNGNVVMSARQVPQLTSKQVYVVPSDSMAQGVAALLAFNYENDYDANCQAMDGAIGGVKTVEVTRAVRSVQIDGVDVAEGDIIGLIDGKLIASGGDMDDIVRRTLERAEAGMHEIATLYYGQGIAEPTAQAMAERVKGWYGNLEVEVVNGGQPFYAYIISVE